MATDKQILLDVLQSAKELISRQGNDFSWSGWDNAAEALAEIQGIEEQIANNDFSCLRTVNVLFLPTGPMQELSISSGWADEFLGLAERFDEVIQRLM